VSKFTDIIKCNIKHQHKFIVDLRITDNDSYQQLSQVLQIEGLTRCAEIHIDGEHRLSKSLRYSPEILIDQSTHLCEWLFIKDCSFVYFGDSLKKKTRTPARSLTLIDSKICNFESFITSLEAKSHLQTFVIIYNEDLPEFYGGSTDDDDFIVE
jgi:hypothetical protein